HVGVDIVNRLHVIVIDHLVRDTSLSLRDIAQKLRAPRRRMDWGVEQGARRVHLVRRSLHDYRIIDAVGRIHPPIWTKLLAGTERAEKSVSYVELPESHLLSSPAIHFKSHQRNIVHLVDVDIGSAGDLREPGLNLLRNRVVLFHIASGTDDLHI